MIDSISVKLRVSQVGLLVNKRILIRKEMIKISFAENLTRVQAEHKETNYRLAKEIGVCQTSIKNWKEGTHLPHPKHRRLIEQHYGLRQGGLEEGDLPASPK